MPDNTNAFLAHLPSFHRALYRWYKAEGRRDLPWRNTRDPYAIYVSEIMLQQTQVKTVLERHYAPFLKRFPTLKALARAPREEVVKQWEGLGYYTRAANLHAAAQQSGGVLPQTVEALMALPGIGRNTASAVAAFAFNVSVPVMEANVKRVLCRVFALPAPDDKELWDKATLLLDAAHPFDYNQAMMDVGALLCTKRNPLCGECPLNAMCKGKAAPQSYPAPRAAKQVPVRKRVIVAFHDADGLYYLMRREGRFLTGMYGFMEYDEGTQHAYFLGQNYPLRARQRIGHIMQTYSHFTLDAEVYACPVDAGPQTDSNAAVCMAALADIERYPLSRADQKIVALLILSLPQPAAAAKKRRRKTA
jgi:A/G-specific adenine glycosylase